MAFFKSCIVSRSFLQHSRNSEDELIECKYTNPPFSILETDEFSCYNNVTSFCYFPKRQESLFNKLFDGIYCINLTTRPDRLKEFEKRMEKHNIKFERFNAVSKSFLSNLANISMPLLETEKNVKMSNSGLLGCLLSHLNVMKTALSRNQKQILIFEDDASVHKDANLLLLNFVQSLNKMSINIRDIDCIHFGYVPVVVKGDYDNPDVWSYRFLQHVQNNGNVLKSKHFLCNHAYAVNEKFMKAFIKVYFQFDQDEQRLTPNDWKIRNLFLENPDFTSYAPCPQIFGVKPFFSDNANGVEDDIERRVTNTNYTYFDDYE
jgi:GR25 family glycosyltransferase involved in LPS biosynthesis